MTQENIPEVYRRGDIPGRANTSIPAVAQVVKEILPAVQSGGGFGEFDGLVAMVERVWPLFEKFSNKFMEVKNYEAGSQVSTMSHGQDLVENMANPNVPPQGESQTQVFIEPIKIYALALKYIAQLDPNLSAGQVLEMLRSNKEMALMAIQKELEALAKGD